MCLQTRSANKTVRVKHHMCSSQPRPERRRVCNVQECSPEWRSGRWTKCSSTCGEGKRRRQVVCRTRHHRLPEHYCSHSTKPTKVEACQTKPCLTELHWTLSNWSECSVSCGEGIQTRSLHCSGINVDGVWESLPQTKCSHLKEEFPESLRQTCKIKACEKTYNRKWFVSPWSQCSVTCGIGTQIRLIRCMDSMTGQPGTSCDPKEKPVATQSCNISKSCDQDYENCEDDWNMCHLVPQHNLCAHHFYGKQCCKSCQENPQTTESPDVT